MKTRLRIHNQSPGLRSMRLGSAAAVPAGLLTEERLGIPVWAEGVRILACPRARYRS